MAGNDKDNSGAFFLQDKGDNDKKPDYRGNLLAKKEKLFVAVWKRVAAKSGNEFYSLSFSIPNSDFSIKDPDPENNKGVLFSNSKKEKDTHPDFQGKAKILGVNYYIDAWKKEKDGKDYFSFTLKEIEEKNSNEGQDSYNQDHSQSGGDDSQQIPFDEEQQSQDDSGAFNIFTMGQQ